MGYLTRSELERMAFRDLGRNVLVSDRASLYFPETISIGDDSRIDDFCIISGDVSLGRNVHVAAYANIAGGSAGIILEDFSAVAYACHVLAQSDDYSGRTMTNPTVPREFRAERFEAVRIGRHSILGTQTVVLPGCHVAEGCSTGAQTVVTRPTQPWSIYIGNPAKRLGDRSKDLLDLERRYAERDEEAQPGD